MIDGYIDLSMYRPDVQSKHVGVVRDDGNRDVIADTYPDLTVDDCAKSRNNSYYAIKVLVKERKELNKIENIIKTAGIDNISIKYSSPNFFITCGKFFSNIVALSCLNTLKVLGVSAFVVKMRDMN